MVYSTGKLSNRSVGLSLAMEFELCQPYPTPILEFYVSTREPHSQGRTLRQFPSIDCDFGGNTRFCRVET